MQVLKKQMIWLSIELHAHTDPVSNSMFYLKSPTQAVALIN